MLTLSTPTTHEHSCGDCATAEPWPGEEHDAFCAWIGLCAPCELVHKGHCSCRAVDYLRDVCSLQPAWVEAMAGG